MLGGMSYPRDDSTVQYLSTYFLPLWWIFRGRLQNYCRWISGGELLAFPHIGQLQPYEFRSSGSSRSSRGGAGGGDDDVSGGS